MTTPDVVDALVGIRSGDLLDAVRRARPDAREHAQKSHEAIFAPADPAGVTIAERHALGAVAAGFSAEPRLVELHLTELVRAGGSAWDEAIADVIARHATGGPVGVYREPGLAAESVPTEPLVLDAATRDALGERLAVAIEHFHLLAYRPRESSAPALQRLLDAGWSTTDVVTISQLAAFTAFQARLIVGLSVLAANPATETEAALAAEGSAR